MKVLDLINWFTCLQGVISILECSGMFQESPFVFLKQVTLHFILTQEGENPAESIVLDNVCLLKNAGEECAYFQPLHVGGRGLRFHKAPSFPGWSPSSPSESGRPWAPAPCCILSVSWRVELERSMTMSSTMLTGLPSSKPLWGPAWRGLELSLRCSEPQSAASFSSHSAFLIVPADFLCIPGKKK